jgi:hypothetical protein
LTPKEKPEPCSRSAEELAATQQTLHHDRKLGVFMAWMVDLVVFVKGIHCSLAGVLHANFKHSS